MSVADYKRLVSYMYNYENGIKRNNIGYARVEVRNGQCKVTINIKALSFNNASLKAYIFKHDGDKNKCFNLGDVIIKGGNGELRTITNSNNIANSTYSIDDMAGIVVYNTPDKFFATEWDDNPIVKFDLDEIWNENRLAKKEEKEEEIENIVPIKEVKEVIPIETEIVQKNIDETQNSVVDISNNETELLGKLDEKQEDKKQLSVSVTKKDNNVEVNKEETYKKEEEDNTQKEPINISSNIQDLIRNITNIIDNKTKDSISKNASVHETNDQLDHVPTTKSNRNNEFANAKEKEANSNKKELNKYSKEKELNANEIDEKENRCLYPIDYTFFDYYRTPTNEENAINEESIEINQVNQSRENKIFGSYPKLNPFEDNNIIDCVKIEPQDIGIFPMEFWVLGNNSFLLHAYYNYRHLLLAKRRKENEEEYILGVPGIYENREKFIANMFGFYDFKGVSLKKTKTGDFGYWLLDVKL